MSPLTYKFKKHLYQREHSVLGRQRFVIFEAVAILSILLKVMNFFMLPTELPMVIFNIVVCVITIGLVVLYRLRKLSVRLAATILYLLLQVELSVQKIVYATLGTPETAALIVQASFLSLLLITVAIVSHLRYSPSVISGLSILTFTFCLIIFPNPILLRFMTVYLIVLVGVIIYDLVSTRSINEMEDQHNQLRTEIHEFMRATGLSYEDLHAITELSRNNADKTEKTRKMLALMDARARKNIVGSVLSVKAENETTRAMLTDVFPDLSPTQIAICQLILQDKKLTEICQTLGKNESNVSSQRSRIRTLLRIPADEVLKDALESRVQDYLRTRNMRYEN